MSVIDGGHYQGDARRILSRPAGMTLREQVTAFLKARPGRSLCVACLARALDVQHKRAHQATLMLESSRSFLRHYGRCTVCGKTRLITMAVNHESPTMTSGE